MSQANGPAEDVLTRSIRMLADHGYMETTVEQLAQAAGISRATFFRKYGSKEDMVFADHAATLARLEELLAGSELSAHAGLVEGAQLVFGHNLEHSGRAVARHDLLQRVESLRDREIAMSSRYERVFHGFLLRALPESPDRRVSAVALAAATVAVHNAFLRAWLRNPRPGQGEQLSGALSRRIGWLCATFGVAVGDAASAAPGSAHSAPAEPGCADAAPAEAGAPAGPRPGADALRSEYSAPAPGPDPAPIVVVVPQGGAPAEVAERTARSVYDALRG